MHDLYRQISTSNQLERAADRNRELRFPAIAEHRVIGARNAEGRAVRAELAIELQAPVLESAEPMLG